MPTRNVTLTDELDSFVASEIECGRYENANEVVSAALRSLEREEREYDAKLEALRSAIDAGDASGIAEGHPFARVRLEDSLPAEFLALAGAFPDFPDAEDLR
jgi:antitoxin ParD1/3/4